MFNKKYLASLGVLALVASFAVGTSVFADNGGGQGRGDGQVMPMMKSGIMGNVTAVSGSTLTVQNRRDNTAYTVDASSAVVTKANATSSVASIVVGDIVAVQGAVSGTNVVAAKIYDGEFQGNMGKGMGLGRDMMKGQKPAVVGVVRSISGSTLTVTNRGFDRNASSTITYTVNASNATILKGNATSSLSSVAVGDTVFVQGTLSGTTITATIIRDGMMRGGKGDQGEGNALPQGNGQPVVAGTVSSISGSTITITNSSNATYTIDASSAKITKGGNTATITDIAVGDRILAQGTVNGTSVTASLVFDQTHLNTVNGGNDNNQGAPENHPQKGARSGFFGWLSHLFGF